MNKNIFTTALLLSLVGCALPGPKNPASSFISNRELKVAAIMRESSAHFGRGRFIDAELGLRQARFLFPDARNITLNLAQALARNGQRDETQQLFESERARRPEALDLLVLAGESFYDSGEIELATGYLEDALQRAESSQDIATLLRVSRDLSVLYFRVGRLEHARCAAQFVKANDATVEPVVRAARIDLGIGAYTAVVESVDTFMATHPGERDPRLFYVRAVAKYGLDRFAEARVDFEKALERAEKAEAHQGEISALQVVFSKLPKPVAAGATPSPEESKSEPESELDVVELRTDSLVTLPPNLVIAYKAAIAPPEDES